MGRILLITSLLFSFSLYAQDDGYYDDEPVSDGGYDAYEAPVAPQIVPKEKMTKELPNDAYEDGYERPSDEPPAYAEPDAYSDDPYPENEESGNYDDSY